jgi:hypothetical protein
MAPKEPKLSKQAAAVTTRHITFTILDTLEIIRKSGNATRQNVIMAAYKIRLLNMHGTKKRKKILSVRTEVGRGRVKGLYYNLAPLQACGCQIK